MMIKLYDITQKRPNIIIYLVAAFCFALLSSNNHERLDLGYDKGIEHGIVYYKDGRFGGWPANHGIWSWQNEILVGFVEAAHMDRPGHTYDRTTARDKFARSRDGGLTWIIEDAFAHGQTGWRDTNMLPEDKAEQPRNLEERINFKHSDLALKFVRETNDTGPSHFYYSYDRGNLWRGPFKLPDFETPGVASRTDYIIDGKHELMAFFTVSKSNNRQGRILCARTKDGGISWQHVAWIGPEPEGFDIMPSSVRLSSTEIITTIRTRTGDRLDKITAYISQDNGITWEQLRDPVADTGRAGSPPALVKLDDGRLALGYAYRSEHGSRINVRFSSDNGKSWSDEIMLRGGDGATRDIGYPRMLQRPDGKMVMIYYWNNACQKDAKPYRFIAYTIFDPDNVAVCGQ